MKQPVAEQVHCPTGGAGRWTLRDVDMPQRGVGVKPSGASAVEAAVEANRCCGAYSYDAGCRCLDGAA
jgi:hypothetical protein